ncbi:MAG TPA: tetratricopeptide repeat protein [Acidobacteriaceae bacterium]|jgi:tetratricopeptide (TPR) repeat protein|nr:tetratricopeptide repeat protein [Acidobacteriaceae bacterium]
MSIERTNPTRPWMPYLLALSFLFLSPILSLAQSGDDEVTPQVEQLYAQARTAQQNHDEAAAITKYREILKLAPHLAAAYNNLGMLYFNQSDYAHAAEVLEHGLKVNAKMPTAAAMLGMSYFQLGEAEKAEPLLKAAVHANPADDRTEMMLAHNEINLKKYDEATRTLKEVLARDPKNQQAWYDLGKTYLRMSEDSLAKINQIDPNSVVAHEITGEIDESMHNYDSALVEYKKAVDMAPHQPGTHMHMANAFWLTGKWQSAEEEFKAELENDPNDCTARWKMANAMLEANDPSDAALTQLNQSIELCPNLMQARVDRARALIRLGKHDDAYPDLQMAEKDSPNEPSIHFLLASVYRSQGKSAEAQKELQTYGRLQREASAAVAGQASGASAIKNEAH